MLSVMLSVNRWHNLIFLPEHLERQSQLANKDPKLPFGGCISLRELSPVLSHLGFTAILRNSNLNEKTTLNDKNAEGMY